MKPLSFYRNLFDKKRRNPSEAHPTSLFELRRTVILHDSIRINLFKICGGG